MDSKEELSKYYWGEDYNSKSQFTAIEVKDEKELEFQPPEAPKNSEFLVANGFYFKSDGTLVNHSLSCGYMVDNGNWKLNDNAIEMVIRGRTSNWKIVSLEPGKKLTLEYIK